MQTKSAKAKGRRLQNWVKAHILFWNPGLIDSDVRTAIMGETNADIKLSSKAFKRFKYKVECKNRKGGFKFIYDCYQQCINHKEKGEPLLIIKMDRQKPLAVVDAEYFINLNSLLWRTNDK